jgi:hypothetical protein
VTALSLGSAYPLLSNARIRPSDGQGHIVTPPSSLPDILVGTDVAASGNRYRLPRLGITLPLDVFAHQFPQTEICSTSCVAWRSASFDWRDSMSHYRSYPVTR